MRFLSLIPPIALGLISLAIFLRYRESWGPSLWIAVIILASFLVIAIVWNYRYRVGVARAMTVAEIVSENARDAIVLIVEIDNLAIRQLRKLNTSSEWPLRPGTWPCALRQSSLEIFDDQFEETGSPEPRVTVPHRGFRADYMGRGASSHQACLELDIEATTSIRFTIYDPATGRWPTRDEMKAYSSRLR